MNHTHGQTFLPPSSLGTFSQRLREFNKTLHFENLARAIPSTGNPTKCNTIEDMVGASNWLRLDREVIEMDLRFYNNKKVPHKWTEDPPLSPPMTRDEKLSLHLDTIASYTVRRMTHMLMSGELGHCTHKVFAFGIDSEDVCTQIKYMFAGKMGSLGVALNLSRLRSYLTAGGCQLKYTARGS